MLILVVPGNDSAHGFVCGIIPFSYYGGGTAEILRQKKGSSGKWVVFSIVDCNSFFIKVGLFTLS